MAVLTRKTNNLAELGGDTDVHDATIGQILVKAGDGVWRGMDNPLLVAPNTGSFLVTGGEAVWEPPGYTFRVSAATYFIQGVLYSSAEQVITLDAANVSLDRIDLLALNTSGTLQKITGVPAASPAEPDYDPTTQIRLNFVVVKASSTTPSVTTESIYAEGVEWTTSTSLTGWLVNSTNSPRTGARCIEGTNVAAGAYVQFDRGVALDPNGFTLLVLYIKSKAKWNPNRNLMVRFQYSGTVRGGTIPIADGSFGFNSSNVSGYQQVAIPMTQFAIAGGLTVNQLRIGDNGGAIGLFLDDIFMQTGGSTPDLSNYLTQAQGDARYLQRANNLSDLASVSAARTNLGLGTAATHADTDYEHVANRAAVNGYAPLDGSAKVPLANLPSFGTGNGTVTSVDFNAPAAEWTITGAPVTGAGTIILSKRSQPQNTVYAAPSGGAGAPTFRLQVPSDIPQLTLSKITDAGTAASHNDTEYEHVANKGAASGYASLDSGTKVPVAQLPVMVASGGSHAAGIVPDPGSSAGTTRFLREDGTWVNMATGAANLASGQVTASNVAGTLVSSRSTRRHVTVKNTDSTITVYVGPATVTSANGLPLLAGESVRIDFVGLVQVIAASGSPVIAYMEAYD